MAAGDDGDPHPPPGVVELREDIPLKGAEGAGAGARCCAGGPRFILGCFAALSAAITIALLTQIYYGDYEVVPHGSVSSSAARCSRAGADALKAGGRALDAAAAAALCLAVLAPHRTSLDASGSMLYWEYRRSRTQPPELYEWGGPAEGAGAAAAPGRPPRLVAALAALHAELGALPWAWVLQPAIDLARDGFLVSDGLALSMSMKAGTAAEAASAAVVPALPAGTNTTAPQLAAYLQSLQANTSTELSNAWHAAALVRSGGAREMGSWPGGAGPGGGGTGTGGAGPRWRAVAGGAGGTAALRALSAALDPPPIDEDDASRRVIEALQREMAAADPAAAPITAGGVASGLAVIDRLDTYVALVTGISVPFGSGPATAAGWVRDEPPAPLDLAPAILVDDHICGTRYVVGAESWVSLAQGAAALAAGGARDPAAAVERARVASVPSPAAGPAAGPVLAPEPPRPEPGVAALPAAGAPVAPLAAVNVVQQRGDALASHADSRGGGHAWRF